VVDGPTLGTLHEFPKYKIMAWLRAIGNFPQNMRDFKKMELIEWARKYVVDQRARPSLAQETPKAQFAAWGELSSQAQLLEIPRCITDIGLKPKYSNEEQAILDEWNAYKQAHVKPSPIRVIRRLMEEKQLSKVHDVRRAFDAYSMAMQGTERMGPATAKVQEALREAWLKEQARSEAILECLSVIYQNDI
jgi:hypothetical protein